MTTNLAASITAFLFSFIILPVVIKFFKKHNLMDTPGGRKIHKKVTPSLGGIGIFVGFVIAILVWMKAFDWGMVRYVLASLLIVFLLGVRDDLVPFKARIKLLGQIVSVIVLAGSGIVITSFYGLFDINSLPVVASYSLTGIVIIAITNSFNLIDGLDGLAASVGMVALLAFGIWFQLSGDLFFSLLCFTMIGAILGFLVFNWEPAQIFMGDTGAMVIGMLLGILAIRFLNTNHALSSEHPYKFNAGIATAIGAIIIPVWDTLRIIIIRLSKGQSPFKPDKSHIHHLLMRLGFTHAQTSLTLALIHSLMIILVITLRSYPDTVVLPTIFAIIFTLSIILDRFILRRMERK